MPDIAPLYGISRTEMIVTCANGSQLLFAGLDDVEKIKSLTPAKGALTDIWIEEATEVSRDDYKQLEKRLRGISQHVKRIMLSFNPIFKEHWIYKEFFGGWAEDSREFRSPGLAILKTTYKDNRFLEPDDIAGLENETDEYYRDVYTLGKWGTLGDVVFRNWRVEDLTELKKTADNLFYGLDFGFSTDPAGGLKVHYDRMRKRVYVLGELYDRGLTNQQLGPMLSVFCGTRPITCDSAEPKSIQELRNLGIQALAAKKGPDSVEHGIQWLQGHEIIVDIQCQHLRNELQVYQWRKDKNGNSLRQPEDKNNHLIDSLRYALESESTQRYAGMINLK
jgi:phage terminase large subunit